MIWLALFVYLTIGTVIAGLFARFETEADGPVSFVVAVMWPAFLVMLFFAWIYEITKGK